MVKKIYIWEELITSLESDISETECKTWFCQTTLKKLDNSVAVIHAPNKFIAAWLKEKYITQIQSCFKNKLNILPDICFTYDTPVEVQGIPIPESKTKNAPHFSHRLNPLCTFDNFVLGSSNQFAYSSALQAANKPGGQYNPLYIFCKPSLGKTHLLNAIGNWLVENKPLQKIRYLSVGQFHLDYSLASKSRKTTKFRKTYGELDFLLVDEVDNLVGREKTQEELILILDCFCGSKKQIVFAGKRPPGRIHNLLPRLRSRLEWGLISEIQAPNQETKINIIKNKAQNENIHMPDDVIFFLANATDDLKILIQYFVSLETYSSLYQREIDMSMVKSIIRNAHSSNIGMHDIQKLTASHFNLSLSDLVSDKKGRKFSYPRQIAMYLSRKLTDLSYKEIGKEFGKKDHTTVIYAVKRVEKDKNTKKGVSKDINKLKSLLS